VRTQVRYRITRDGPASWWVHELHRGTPAASVQFSTWAEAFWFIETQERARRRRPRRRWWRRTP